MEHKLLGNTEIEPFILYDDRNFEMLPLIEEEMRRQGIKKYHIRNPILCSPVFKSISLSQKAIVQEAKDKGMVECCLMEEDIWFPAGDGWQYFISNKPDKYSIYLGGSYLVDNRVEYTYPVTKVKAYVGHHCIIIHESYYDTFLATSEKGHIDTEQEGRGDFYLCYPMAALQRPSKSANANNEMVNYNYILKKENIQVYGYSVHNI